MDQNTYDRFEQYGSPTDAAGSPLRARASRPVPELTPDEADLYHRLLSPTWDRPRRIEQERIPLTEARATLDRLAAGSVD